LIYSTFTTIFVCVTNYFACCKHVDS